MKATFLGTGTSHGVPMIGCRCPVCTSSDPRNVRRRSSLYLESAGTGLIFDTTPEFREQCIRFGVGRVDAVFITHAHADHIFGFDDVRRFCHLQQTYIPVYGSPDCIAVMRRKFDYVDKPSHSFGGVPRVQFTPAGAPVETGPFRVTPLPVRHGREMIYGFLAEADGARLAYIPDCSGIPDSTLQLMENMTVVILDGLRPEPHSTHFSTAQSVEMLRRIGAPFSFVTHLTHSWDHAALQDWLPDGFYAPWDGLCMEVEESGCRFLPEQ